MKVQKSEEDWKRKLTPEQFKILREKGTEPAFSGKYVDNHEDGIYFCMACHSMLFDSSAKFESGSGWPSFYDVVKSENVIFKEDYSLGAHRTEVICANCGGHLGHVFEDGPKEKTGLRYCINSCALNFNKKEKSSSSSEEH